MDRNRMHVSACIHARPGSDIQGDILRQLDDLQLCHSLRCRIAVQRPRDTDNIESARRKICLAIPPFLFRLRAVPDEGAADVVYYSVGHGHLDQLHHAMFDASK